MRRAVTFVALVLFACFFLSAGTQSYAAKLVAAWPLNDGPAGDPATAADDIIDDPGHPAADATEQGSGGTWYNHPERGIVYRTVQDHRFMAGTQGITTNFSWSVWVEILGDASGTILGTRDGDGVVSAWNKLTPNKIETWAGCSGWSISTNEGVWHHLVVRGVVNPGGADQKVEVYFDGSLAGTDNNTASLAFNGDFQIGGNDHYTEDIEGYMSDVAIWSNDLSVAEIKALYSLGSNSNLYYKAYDAQQLFDLYRAAGGAPISIDGDKWYYTDKLLNDATTDGELFELGDGKFELAMNSVDDSGVTMLNPAAGTVLVIK